MEDPVGEREEEEDDKKKLEVKKEKKNTEDDKNKKSGDESQKQLPVFEDVCEAYKRKQCPHGTRGTILVNGKACGKNHPPMCGFFVRHGTTRGAGCKKGKECPRYHPPICRDSERKRECYKENCQRIHLKDTRRKRVVNFVPTDSSTNRGGQKLGKEMNGKRTQSPKESADKGKPATPAVTPGRYRTKSAPAPSTEHPSPQIPTNNTVDQDFLMLSMGILRDGIMEEIKLEMKKLMEDHMRVLMMELTGRNVARAVPTKLRQTEISPSAVSTPTNPPSYHQMIQRFQSFCSSTPVA